MAEVFVIYIFATIDAICNGIREAGGRSALIDKRDFYFKAARRAFLLGQALTFVCVLIVLISFATSNDHALLFQAYIKATRRLLVFFVPFTFIVMSAFLIRIIPSVDIRGALSLVVFGPMTLLRPLVGASAVLYAVWPSGDTTVSLTFAVCMILFIAHEYILAWVRKGVIN